MDLSEFKSKAEVTEVNTTNGWGFGGYAGKEFKYKNYSMRKAKYFYRHTRPTPYNCFCYKGKEVTKKEFETKLNNLK